MTCTDLSEILDKHELWLKNADGGKCANLEGANLDGVNLEGKDLRSANLRYADLGYADLGYANLRGANLKCTKLEDADLRYTIFAEANLVCADMRGADMRDANIDYSAWPLWCGSLKTNVDDRIAIQLLYHTLSVVQHSPYVSDNVKRTLLTSEVVEVANRFHFVDECGKLEIFNGGEEA